MSFWNTMVVRYQQANFSTKTPYRGWSGFGLRTGTEQDQAWILFALFAYSFGEWSRVGVTYGTIAFRVNQEKFQRNPGLILLSFSF